MPFLRAFIPLIPGIITYPFISTNFIFLLSLVALAIQFIFSSFGIKYRYRLRLLPGCSLAAALFCLGYFSMWSYDIRNNGDFIGPDPQPPMIAIIASEPKKGRTNFSFELEVRLKRFKGFWQPTTGKILGRTRFENYHKGDSVLLLSRPELLNPKIIRNPGFLNYLKRRNITHQIYISENELRPIGRSQTESLIGQLRNTVLKIMNTDFGNPEERAFAKALLVGSREDLDPDLATAYTNTGVIHVVAISGMHLALIYALISYLLKPLQNKRTRLIRTALIIMALWIFSLVCGASPSVVRSAVMFSFILTGEAIGRDHQIGNTLAGSAFLMLCIQPILLWDIGFQLSYAAVASLLIYNKPLSALLVPENQILNQAWNIISTTISAQILTTPLAIYHFGQFPILFLLANIVAVPLSGIILILLFLICILQPLGFSTPLAMITGFLIRFMNDRIKALDNVSFATIRNIHINIFDTINIYIILIALTLWWRWKK